VEVIGRDRAVEREPGRLRLLHIISEVGFELGEKIARGDDVEHAQSYTDVSFARLQIAFLCATVIHMTNSSNTTSVVSVRVNPDERAILEAAAELAHTNLSDFMRRKALESAEADVLNRTIVTIPAKDWEAFEAWVKRPAEAIPALAELARRTPSRER
jgi:uncharacterized protein (DUF1778 family)